MPGRAARVVLHCSPLASRKLFSAQSGAFAPIFYTYSPGGWRERIRRRFGSPEPKLRVEAAASDLTAVTAFCSTVPSCYPAQRPAPFSIESSPAMDVFTARGIRTSAP
jgi:hypothetical protein